MPTHNFGCALSRSSARPAAAAAPRLHTQRGAVRPASGSNRGAKTRERAEKSPEQPPDPMLRTRSPRRLNCLFFPARAVTGLLLRGQYATGGLPSLIGPKIKLGKKRGGGGGLSNRVTARGLPRLDEPVMPAESSYGLCLFFLVVVFV